MPPVATYLDGTIMGTPLSFGKRMLLLILFESCLFMKGFALEPIALARLYLNSSAVLYSRD